MLVNKEKLNKDKNKFKDFAIHYNYVGSDDERSRAYFHSRCEGYDNDISSPRKLHPLSNRSCENILSQTSLSGDKRSCNTEYYCNGSNTRSSKTNRHSDDNTIIYRRTLYHNGLNKDDNYKYSNGPVVRLWHASD